MQDFPPGERQVILEQFPKDHTDSEFSQAVLFALSILPLQSVQQCCYDILSFLREKDLKTLGLKSSFSAVVYLICLESLRYVNSDEIFETIYIETINEYKIYLQLDAIIGRSIIFEILGEPLCARDEIKKLIANVLSDDDADIDSLKLSFQTSVLYAICRLPLLESLAGFHTESLASYKRCVSGDSILKNRISSATKSALNFAASMLFLDEAMHSRSEDVASMNLQNALSLLQATQQIMSGRGSVADYSPKPLEHMPQSIVNKLPNTIASPEHITSFATPGKIAVLLIAISSRVNRTLTNHVELLEWGISFEVQLDIETLWSLACSYIMEDDNEKALSILEQAHHALVAIGESRQSTPYNIQKSQFSNIVSWLSVGPHPIQCPWLPTIRAIHICLDKLCSPHRALEIIYRNTKDLYPSIKDIFITLRDAATQESNSFDPLQLLLIRVENDENVDEDLTTYRKGIKLQSEAYFMGIKDELESGNLEILFDMGRSFAMASRTAGEVSFRRRNYRRVASIVFEIIIQHYNYVFKSPIGSYPEKLLIEHALILAEAGEIDYATSVVRSAAKTYPDSNKLAHLLSLLLVDMNGDEDVNAIALQLCQFSFSSTASMNSGLTCALMNWFLGETRRALHIVGNLVGSLRQHILGSGKPSVDDMNISNPSDKFVLDWNRSPQALRLSIEILITSSSMFRQSDMIAAAQECTDMAFRLLYTVNEKSIEDLLFSSESDRIELLRRLPHGKGWRLRDARGWGAVSLPDCEADIIAECAAQYLTNGDRESATELYKIALGEFPTHIPTLLALAELEIGSKCSSTGRSELQADSWYPDASPVTGPFVDIATRDKDTIKDENDIVPLASALQHATLALRLDDESFDAW